MKIRTLIPLLALALVTACTGNTYSELQLASARGQTDMVKIMLEKGVDINQKNRHEKTALMLAAAAGHTETVSLLAEHNAHLDAQDIDGMTALMEASANGHAKTITALLNAGANVNTKNKYSATALTNAVFFGHVDATKALLESKVRLHDDTAENALLVAAGLGNNELLEILLAYGIDINARGKNGRTPIMAAITFNHVASVRFLIDRKANLSLSDADGDSVLKIAMDKGNEEVIEMLKKSGAK